MLRIEPGTEDLLTYVFFFFFFFVFNNLQRNDKPLNLYFPPDKGKKKTTKKGERGRDGKKAAALIWVFVKLHERDFDHSLSFLG